MKKTTKCVQVGATTYYVFTSHYPSNGALAIVLDINRLSPDPETMIVLSVNMDHGQDNESKDLPANCFYVPQWQTDVRQIMDACIASGHFQKRGDLPVSHSGYVSSPAWEFVE